MSTGIKNPRTPSVHAPNSDEDRRSQLATVLHLMNTGQGAFAKMSWRDIADFFERYYQAEFSHSTLRRYAWPVCDPVVNPEHCAAFDLTPLVEAHACTKCHEAPTVCLCDKRKLYDPDTEKPYAMPGTHEPRNRGTVNFGDPESAAATIIPRVSTEYRRRLAELLDY